MRLGVIADPCRVKKIVCLACASSCSASSDEILAVRPGNETVPSACTACDFSDAISAMLHPVSYNARTNSRSRSRGISLRSCSTSSRCR